MLSGLYKYQGFSSLKGDIISNVHCIKSSFCIQEIYEDSCYNSVKSTGEPFVGDITSLGLPNKLLFVWKYLGFDVNLQVGLSSFI